MPLQKAPPPSASIHAPSLTIRHAVRERRRTLQTISELHVSSHKTSPEINTTVNIKNTNEHFDARTTNGHVVVAKARKAPRPWTGDFERQPTMLVTAADASPLPIPTTRLPNNDDPTVSKRHDTTTDKLISNRRSLRMSLLGGSTTDDRGTSADRSDDHGMHTKQPMTQEISNADQRATNKPIAVAESPYTVDKESYHRGSHHVRRHSEREMRERAIAEAKACGRGITFGNPASTVPHHRRMPPSGYNQGNQRQLLENSRSMNGVVHNGHDRKSADALEDANINAQLLKNTITNSTSHLAILQHSRQRSRSTSSISTTVSRSIANNHGSPQAASSSNTTRTNNPKPSPAAQTRGRESRISQPTDGTNVRSYSAHSTSTVATSASGKTGRSRRRSSPAPRSSRSSISRKHGVTKEHLDALAALTAPAPVPNGQMTPESLALYNSQQKQLDEKLRRASAASERAVRMSQAQGRGRSISASRVSLHSVGTDTSSRYKVGPNGQFIANNVFGQETLDGLTPESVRLLREREKLLRWKAEREKAEFQMREREKIKERVRRANEMEEARNRDLEKRQKKKKQRGCCGLF